MQTFSLLIAYDFLSGRDHGLPGYQAFRLIFIVFVIMHIILYLHLHLKRIEKKVKDVPDCIIYLHVEPYPLILTWPNVHQLINNS